MTDEQIVAAAKAVDTPHGKISLIHTREDGSEVPTFVAKQFARAILGAQLSAPAAQESMRLDSSDIAYIERIERTFP